MGTGNPLLEPLFSQLLMHLSSIQIEIHQPRKDELLQASALSTLNSASGQITLPAAQLSTPNSQLSTADPPILDFIASDETLDRFGDVICASGWHLDTYRRNPVFQNAHQYGDILFTLGKALITEVRLAAPERETGLAASKRSEGGLPVL